MKSFREMAGIVSETNYEVNINEAAKPKIGVIISMGNRGNTRWIGTAKELTYDFLYTLEVGHAYKHEEGNENIDLNPKTVKALAEELGKSLDNSGNSGAYWYKDATRRDFEKYAEEGSFSEKE